MAIAHNSRTLFERTFGTPSIFHRNERRPASTTAGGAILNERGSRVRGESTKER